nr:unnamed protein product [Spirometra erinaceieuropaei]
MELFESDSRVVSKALVGHKNQVTCSKFAGENVLSASLDRTVRLWKSVLEEEDSEVICTHPEGVLSMGKTSKDEKIISGSKHGDIYLQDLESGVFLAKHNVGSSVVGLDIEDHGRIFIAAVVAYPEVLIWDLRSGSHPVRIKSVHGKAITSCCILRGEDRIITTSLDKTARVYDLRSNETTLTLRYHSNAVSCAAVSPDNRVLVTGSWDRELFLFDLNTGAYRTGGPVALKGGHAGCVKCCAISDDGCHVMSGGMENNMSVWNSVSGRKLTTLEGHSGDVNSERCNTASSTHYRMIVMVAENLSCAGLLSKHRGSEFTIGSACDEDVKERQLFSMLSFLCELNIEEGAIIRS